MRTWILSLLMLVFTANVSFAGATVQTATIKTKIACDHCKMCGSCGARIEKAIYAIKGVKRVDVNDKDMEIVVVYNSEKTTIEKIRETITSNGYDADEQKATPESFAKLDGCCKGEE